MSHNTLLSDEELNTKVIQCAFRAFDFGEIDYNSRNQEGRHLELASLLQSQWNAGRDLYLYFEYLRLVDTIDILFTPDYNRSGKQGSDYKSEWPWRTKFIILDIVKKIFQDGFEGRGLPEKIFAVSETLLFFKKSQPIFKENNDQPLRRVISVVNRKIEHLGEEGEVKEMLNFIKIFEAR